MFLVIFIGVNCIDCLSRRNVVLHSLLDYPLLKLILLNHALLVLSEVRQILLVVFLWGEGIFAFLFILLVVTFYLRSVICTNRCSLRLLFL
jgi:hypothetical protein